MKKPSFACARDGLSIPRDLGMLLVATQVLEGLFVVLQVGVKLLDHAAPKAKQEQTNAHFEQPVY